MAESRSYREGIESMLKRRTRSFSLSILQAVQRLDRDLVTDVLSRQGVRSGTSIGANYRAACRAKSRADMIYKLSIAEEEADETLYWLDLLKESGALSAPDERALATEGEEILKLLVASMKTLKASEAPAAVRESVESYRLEKEGEREALAELLQTPNSKF